MLLFAPLCVSPRSPSLLFSFFLLLYLRSLSDGLTISSSVSLLSCSAVHCLWFAQAHPCGCSFQQHSVTWWIDTTVRGPGPHSFSSPEMGCTPALITWLIRVEEAVGCATWTLFSCRHQLKLCGKRRRAIETLLESKRKDGCASSLFSEDLTVQRPGVPSWLLSSLGHARGSQNTHRQ